MKQFLTLGLLALSLTFAACQSKSEPGATSGGGAAQIAADPTAGPATAGPAVAGEGGCPCKDGGACPCKGQGEGGCPCKDGGACACKGEGGCACKDGSACGCKGHGEGGCACKDGSACGCKEGGGCPCKGHGEGGCACKDGSACGCKDGSACGCKGHGEGGCGCKDGSACACKDGSPCPYQAKTQPAAVAPAPPCGGGCAGAEGHNPAGCDEPAAGGAVPAAEGVVEKRASGETVTHFGPAFSAAPTLAIGDLLKDAAAHAGKAVIVTGDVAAMCHHRRTWFSVAAADKSGQQVRVLAAPAFLAPAGSIGHGVKVEGTLEVVQTSPGMAQHLASEHQVGTGAAGGAPVQEVVLHAVAADFIAGPTAP